MTSRRMTGTRYDDRRHGAGKWLGWVLAGSLTAAPVTLAAETIANFNLYGSPGLIDMPTAGSAADANIGLTYSTFGDNTRSTLTFQITPRLSGSFRYSAIQNFDTPASVDGAYFDRSFDLRYELVKESRVLPSVVVGLQDFIGTGLYGGEYVVASKTVAPGLRLTGGLGWGRLGSYQPLTETGTRPVAILGRGGVPNYDRFFRGDVAAFGGVSYTPNDRLTFKVEYSSDDYVQERATGQFKKSSPWNYGIDYRFGSGAQLSLYHAYGEEVGAQLTFFINPKTAPVPGGSDTAPLPVSRRDGADIDDLGWTLSPNAASSAKSSLSELLAADGLIVEGLTLTGNRATLRLRNTRFYAVPQAVGRAARAMTRTLPASVEEFVIVPMENGMAMSAIEMRRTDLEDLENDAAVEMLAQSNIVDGFRRAPAVDPGLYPKFEWALAPYTAFSLFDPDNPFRADAGLRLEASYLVTPNIVLAGSVTKKFVGNLDSVTRGANTRLPQVRTSFPQYSREGDPAIEYLTATAYARPARDFYSRFTVGYLEPMYAGASAEVLWKPVDSRLALGAELNYVQRRDFDQLFGVQSNTTASGVIPDLNGHVSAYYAFGNGFHGRLDVGRYLAGDLGATISLDREFANGWRVGAYATSTDASFEDFGEGSFDKGIRFSIPLGWSTGTATRKVSNLEIKSLTRDGGARLNVNGRLYEQVRNNHRPNMARTWGRFWR